MHIAMCRGVTGAVASAAALATLLAVAAPVVADQRGTPGTLEPPKTTSGRVYIVQALPETDVSIAIDGKEPTTGVGTSEIVGPLQLAPGRHEITVRGEDEGWEMAASVDVSPGRSVDVVLHRPASPSEAPVVTVYRAPLAPVAQEKGRLLLAHTATVPPADVRLDGEVAFANIANGEFVEAEVPAGKHTAEIVPAGRSGPALLGPVALEIPAQTLTSVYAIGRPQDGSMQVVVHQLPLQQRGSDAPDEINTGSAGLVAGMRVTERDRTDAPARGVATTSDTSSGPGSLAWLVGLVLAVGLAGGMACVRRRGGHLRPESGDGA